MKKVLFINTVCGYVATGKIVADLSKSNDFESLVCFGRKKDYANVNSYKFANFLDNASGALRTILFDDNLNICGCATDKLIKKIKEFGPDLINIHNLHGYYVNIEKLLEFLKDYNKPVVLTLHDCFNFTGYCPHFDALQCDKYKTECNNCQFGFSYPFSLFKQNVSSDFRKKKELFNSIKNLTIVCPSNWLADRVKESFLKDKKTIVINNGIIIRNVVRKNSKSFNILAVANYWTKNKGIDELKKIVPLINDDINITIVGKIQDKSGLEKCRLINYISNYEDLAKLYSEASLFINPTLEDNYPTVNLEALSYGCPVLTYNTGGSPEMLNKNNGVAVDKYDYKSFAKMINSLKDNYHFDNNKIIIDSKKFDKKFMLEKYNDLFHNLIGE